MNDRCRWRGDLYGFACGLQGSWFDQAGDLTTAHHSAVIEQIAWKAASIVHEGEGRRKPLLT